MIKCRIAFICFLVFSADTFLSEADAQDTSFKKEIVATIKGEPIYLQEWINQVNIHRASIYSSFIAKYKIQDGSFSWSEKYGQEVPWQVLKDKALQESIRIKLQLLLMKEKGLLPDVSYEAFIKELKEVNQKRKLAVANHEVIYGPIEYSEKIYFNYLFTNNLSLLKESLQQKELLITDPHLKAYYEKVKENYKNTSGQYLSFEEVKNSLRRNYLDAKYEELIDHLQGSSKIEINRNVYDKIIP